MPWHHLYSVARSYQPVGKGKAVAEMLIAELNKRVDRGDVQVFLQTTATKLICDDAGVVVGVVATDKSGKEVEFYGQNVVLSTGGYAASRDLVEKYHPQQVNSVLNAAPAFQTGDGLIMATEIGADLVNMDILFPMPGAVENPDRPGTPMASVRLGPDFAGAIWVNQDGGRFVNEDTLDPDEREKAVIRQSDWTTYIVFDSTVKNSNTPIVANWTWDKFEAEAAKEQNFFKAATVADLAAKIGVDPKALQSTIDTYNGYVDQKRDKDFKRPTLKYKLETGP